jgi:hypothetical protein
VWQGTTEWQKPKMVNLKRELNSGWLWMGNSRNGLRDGWRSAPVFDFHKTRERYDAPLTPFQTVLNTIFWIKCHQCEKSSIAIDISPRIMNHTLNYWQGNDTIFKCLERRSGTIKSEMSGVAFPVDQIVNVSAQGPERSINNVGDQMSLKRRKRSKWSASSQIYSLISRISQKKTDLSKKCPGEP